mgnify:CR=1 FL=1
MKKEIFPLLPKDKKLAKQFVGWYWKEIKGEPFRMFVPNEKMSKEMKKKEKQFEKFLTK